MKKALLILVTATIILSLCGCGEKGEAPAPQAQGEQQPIITEEATESITEAEQGGTTIKITGNKLSKDYEDKDILVVTYEFSHSNEDATSFTFLFQDKAYQNGVECSSLVVGCDDIDAQKQLNDIKAGVTYTVEVGYILSDKSDVEIEVTDLFGTKTYLTETIKLS